jgi:hypothetical protein
MKAAWLMAALLAAGCATPGVPGIYTDERQARITLKPGGEASVQVARFFAEGLWREDGERIAIDLAGERPQRLVFDRSGPQLVAKEWDRTVWGEAGPPVMYRLVRR